MENFELTIPETETEPKNDLIIIYKGREERQGQIIEPIEEIRTSKEKFLQKLRYFRNKSNEISQMNEIFIHDEYPIKVFKDFINVINTRKLIINEQNYVYFLKLSTKYEYNEMKREVEKFAETRPDIDHSIENYSNDEIDELKEEKLAKHLDIFLMSKSLMKYPIQKLNRILNSPKRKLKNHHLLFDFVKKYINERGEKEKKEELEVLISSLDYLEMSDDELDEFLSDKKFISIFEIRHSKEMVNKMYQDKKKSEERFSSFEKNVQEKFDEIMKKCLEQEQIIQQYHQENEMLKSTIQNQLNEVLPKQIKMNEKLKNEMMQNYSKQENLIQQYHQENEKMQSLIETQSIRIKELEEKIKILMSPKVTGSISINVEPNQIISGMIRVNETGIAMDTNKSKYILNTNNASTIGSSEYENGFAIGSVSQKFSYNKPKGTYYMHALIVDTLGHRQEIVSHGVTTDGVKPFTFDYTGRVQSIKLSEGSYKLEVWGAEGGETSESSVNSVKGGYSVVIFKISTHTTLYVYVGQKPSSSSGGWNGGGNGKSPGAGGGGSTDISLYGNDGSTQWNTSEHLYSRIIVAGAGGGSEHKNYNDKNGFGGGLNGGDRGIMSGGGQTGTPRNHSNCSTDQGFGVGGSNTYNSNSSSNHSSGGGGGWYGGCAYSSSGYCPGGAGGSGYVYDSSTASSYPSGCRLSNTFYLEDARTIAGNNQIPKTSGLGSEEGHNGHGYAKITPQ